MIIIMDGFPAGPDIDGSRIMTEKIYYQDAFIREFDAAVISCTANPKGYYETVLDRTAFYPEGGGQNGDTGWLVPEGNESERIEVFDTHEKDGLIRHYTKKPLPEGISVHGVLDFDRRFALMQNHSGEHIVSGLVNSRFGYNNVGFHMGADAVTIDFDGELTMEDLRCIEEAANEIVWKDLETGIHVYDERECENLSYRSKKELHGEVRLVTFPEADVCACCGTHVKRTGQIGLIRIISAERFRGGVRVQMLCGRDAYRYDTAMVEQNHLVSVALSAKPALTGEAVTRLKETAAADAFRVMETEKKLFEMKAGALSGCGNVLLIEEELSPDSLRRLTDAVMKTCGGIACVFSLTQDGARYAIGQENGDLRELNKKLNLELEGRGGGKPFFVQGSCRSGKEQIIRWAQENGFEPEPDQK